jgi:hypothetical protein
MATRGQALFVELQDEQQTTTYARWQSFWIDATVTWEGQGWTYQPMDWSGITSGSGGDQATITLPRLPSVDSIMRRALAGLWLATLRVYQFDESLDAGAPQAGQVLVGSCIGQVISASATATSIELRMGSALSPVGAQFPPVLASDALIGVPCVL